MRTQFITDNSGHKLAIILPIKDYNKMIEDLEDIDDIKMFDESKIGKREFKNAEDVFNEIEDSRKQA